MPRSQTLRFRVTGVELRPIQCDSCRGVRCLDTWRAGVQVRSSVVFPVALRPFWPDSTPATHTSSCARKMSVCVQRPCARIFLASALGRLSSPVLFRGASAGRAQGSGCRSLWGRESMAGVLPTRVSEGVVPGTVDSRGRPECRRPWYLGRSAPTDPG